MTELEQRIIAFTADEIGMSREEVRLDSRLLHDLGMDGDDAIEFFEKFSETFHVELDVLGNNWERHFGPEGLHPAYIAFIAFVGVAVGIAGLLHEAVQIVPIWAWCIPLVPAAIWSCVKTVGVDPRIMPITVQDLVDAAIAGKWWVR